MFKTIF
ncbi:hypothetical protein RDI58_024157 [Solanum bulbocastanum]